MSLLYAVGLIHGDMDDDFMVARMLLSGIPLEEPYIQWRLHILANEEKKSLKEGKLPIKESFYLMGTADPYQLSRGGRSLHYSVCHFFLFHLIRHRTTAYVMICNPLLPHPRLNSLCLVEYDHSLSSLVSF